MIIFAFLVVFYCFLCYICKRNKLKEITYMENKELFQIVQNGYNCEQVEQYINALKAEYTKVVEIAKENTLIPSIDA